jgi:hypothetical protein
MLTTPHRDRLSWSCSAIVLFFPPIDPRKEAFEGEELWHMDSLRLALWHAQHVQGVP